MRDFSSLLCGAKPNVRDDSLYVIELRETSRDYHPVREPHVLIHNRALLKRSKMPYASSPGVLPD
jgi:hypothetical protein